MYRCLKVFNQKANEAAKALVKISLCVMVIAVFAQVVFRYVLKAPLSWSEELAVYFFIWLTFAGASIATREQTHINVSAVVDLIKSEKLRKTVLILANLLTTFFLINLVYYGSRITVNVFQLKQSSPSMTFLNMGVVYIAIPAFSLLMILNLIEISVDLFIDNNKIEAVSKGTKVEGGHK